MGHREGVLSPAVEREAEKFLRRVFFESNDKESGWQSNPDGFITGMAGELLNEFQTEKSTNEVKERLREFFNRIGDPRGGQDFLGEAKGLVEALDLRLRS